MVPSIAYTQTASSNGNNHSNNNTIATLKLRAVQQQQESSQLRAPLPLTNAFREAGIQHEHSTPAIGEVFEKGQLDLAELLNRPEGDQEQIKLLRELAVMVSHRGVVFIRHQPNLSPSLLTKLATKLGELSGKPTSSKLHIHPLSKDFSEFGEFLGEKIDSEADAEGRQISFKSERSNLASAGWHSDISYEPVPADYSMLQIRNLPRSGGDTMWSSGYAAYELLSPAMRVFLEGLTAVHDAEEFRQQSARYGFDLYTKPRGHPANIGAQLQATHPIVRTNPVTGWKALFVNKNFTRRIVELSIDESDALLAYLFRITAESFDFQVRFKWQKDDLAIWDNRSTQHSGIFDFGKAKRNGDRAVSLGEKPYLDPKSKSRSEDLAARGEEFGDVY